MKKSIVLLISLLFIAALSVLILKNLEDTNRYLTSNNHKINTIQMLTSIENIQVEISKIFKEDKKYIDEIVGQLNNTYIPINIKDISLQFKIQHYEKININLLSNKNLNEYKDLKDLFERHEVFDFDAFRYIYKTNEKQYKNNSINDKLINNNKQIDAILSMYIKETNNNKILEFKNKLGFLKEMTDIGLYELFIKVNYLNNSSKAYYILDEKGVVKYFESSFKQK